MGRPSSYAQEVADQICDRMIEGESLNKICADDEMPARVTVYRWLEANPAFRDKYAHAREAQAHYYFELIRDIAFDDEGDFFIENGKMVADHARVQRARLKVDALKWTSSKLLPRIYGDKPAIEADTPKHIQFSWKERVTIVTGVPQPDDPPPPKLIEYHKPELPADLSEEAWSHIVQITELIKKIAPSDAAPEYIFGLIEDWLRQHFLGRMVANG
jgi:hypothetical protein